MALETPEPERIGPYHLRCRLGKGGMGEVFLAWDEHLERHVAIKRIRHDVGTTADRLRRLHREARAAASLNHPAIVQVYHVIEGGGGVDCIGMEQVVMEHVVMEHVVMEYIVMEYVEGETLAQRLAEGTLGGAAAVEIARQVTDGLAEAHARGLIHRDLKAENVMVTPEGQAKILDFGLVKPLDPSSLEETLTHEGALLGTLRAMPPEQATGGEVDPRTDLYSLGVLFYEIFVGHTPFRGGKPIEIYEKILTQPPPPPRVLRPELPAELSTLIESLLEKDPARRPQSASDVAGVLERIAHSPALGKLGPAHGQDSRQLPSDAPTRPPPEAAEPPRARPGNRRARVLAAVLAVTALAALAYFSTAFLPLSSPQPAPDPSSASQTLEDDPAAVLNLYRGAWAKLARFDRPGHVDEAIEGFQRVLASGEMQAAAHAGLARAYWQKYLWRSHDRVWLEQAEDVARRAVELDSDLAAGRVSLALVLVELRRFDEAAAELDEALLLEPQRAEAHFARARLEVSRSRPEAAHAAFESALETGYEGHELYALRGQLHYKEGHYEAAAGEFEKSIELAPDSVLGHRNLSAAYFMLGRHGEAAAELQKALEIQPTPSLYTNLGTLFFYQGLYSKAAEAMEKAVAFPGGASQYLYWGNLGDAYRHVPGRESDARAAYAQAIRLLREKLSDGVELGAAERSRLALFLAKEGRPGDATAELERLEPAELQLPGVLYRAALVHELGGRREEALAALGAALRAGYSLSDVRRDPELLDLRASVGYHRLIAELEPVP